MEEGFMARANFLDPSAQEFHPSSQFVLPHPQFYYPYPPLAPPPPVPSHYVHPPQATDGDASSRAVVLSMVPTHVPESAVTQAMMAFGGVRAVETSFLLSEGIATVHFYDLRSAQVAVAEIREQHVRQQARLQQFYGILPTENWAVQPPANGGRGLIDGQAVWAQFAAKGLDVLNQGSLFVSVSDPAAISSDGVREIFQAFGPVMAVRESPSKPHHKFVEFFDVRDAARALNELNGREIGGGVRLLVEFRRPCGSGHSRSYQHHHQGKRPGQQNFQLPPRLARSSSQASSSSSGGRGGGSQEGVVVPKRNDARISNVSRNGIANNSCGRKNKGGSRSNSNSSSSCYPSSSSSSKQQQQQGSRSKKNWKNHGKTTSKKCEASASSSGGSSSSRFEIKEISSSGESISSSCRSRDSRTTVMIKNIPNKYSQKLLLNMLDNHCILCNEKIVEENREEPSSAYDFVYLPIDFNNKCNVGYGFVNLTSPEAAVRLYKAFHMQPWEVFNSRKICQVTYARLQGLEVLKEHFRNSKFACDNDEYMPVVFDPPRDGKLQLTEPFPIIGGRAGCSSDLPRGITIRAVDLGGASSTTASIQAPSDQEAGADDDVGDSDSETDGRGDRDGGSDETGGSGRGISDQLAASLQLLPSSSS